MLDRLPESRRTRSRPLVHFLVAAAVHAGLAGAALRASGPPPPPPASRVDTMMFEYPVPRPGESVRGAGGTPDRAVPAAPAAPELPPLPPLSVPDGIPAATFASAPARPTLPHAPAGVADLLGPAAGIEGIASSTEGIQPPLLLSAGRPPAVGSGLRGRVEVRFIVDSLGGVDRESIAIVAATDSSLAAAAREIVARARFEPGRSGGRRIPVLVRQHVTFDP